MTLDSMLFIGIRGTVLALDRSTGGILWQTPLKGWDFVNLVRDENVLLATTHGEIFCLDAGTGQIYWNNPLRGLGYGLVTIAATDNTPAMAEKRRRDAADSAAASSSATAGH